MAAYVLLDSGNGSSPELVAASHQLLIDNMQSFSLSVDIVRGINYTVTGFGENSLGNGSITTQLICRMKLMHYQIIIGMIMLCSC